MEGTLILLGVCSSPLLSTSITSSASVLCSSDQLRDVVTLALELLPPLPEASQIVEENRRIISNAGTPDRVLHNHSNPLRPAVFDVEARLAAMGLMTYSSCVRTHCPAIDVLYCKGRVAALGLTFSYSDINMHSMACRCSWD